METTTRGPWRLGDRSTRIFDLTLASLLVLGSASGYMTGSVLATMLSLAETVPLFWRRSRPATVFALVAGASAVQALTYSYPVWGQIAFPVALYSVARFGRPRAGWAALGVSVVATGVSTVVWVNQFDDDVPPQFREGISTRAYLPYLLSIGAIVLAAWALGTQARLRRAYESTLVERGEHLAAEAEQRVRAAAAQERSRVAREMHDVVAHGITGMIVQADGARYAAEQDPEVAARTLGTIAATGRDALGEMRGLLGLLRGTGDPDLLPQPGLEDLESLLAEDVAGGRVVAQLPDALPVVSPGVGLTVYRVVQESLTNVRRHAGPEATASVCLDVDDTALTVAVVDDGRGAAGQRGGGHGLLGMRERVDVHGGTLAAGPVPGGGWQVHARIPR